jgi:putative transposase
MKKRFSEEQIINILKETETGAKVGGVCRKHNVAIQTYYSWKTKFGGMTVSDAQKLRALEDENRKLKRLVADYALDNVALKDLLSKKW